jgi:signal peptidase
MAVIGILLKNPGGNKILLVLSESMEPAIKKGDLIIIKKKPSYSKGDIISFKNNADPNIITHRIVKIKMLNGRYYFTTKGDNNEFDDPYPVSEKEILGKVIFKTSFIRIYNNTIFLQIFLIINMCLGGLSFGNLLGKILQSHKG